MSTMPANVAAEPAEIALPGIDVRALARRAAVPGALLAAVAAVLVIVGGPLGAFADALDRALAADPRWVASAAGFELLSFGGYILLLWLVAGRVTARIDARRATEVTLGGAAATRLLPTGGVGGAALTLWALRKTGIGSRPAATTLLSFLVLLYAVFLGAIVTSGTLIATGVAGADGPLTLSAIPAAGAAIGMLVALTLGLRSRRRAAAPADAVVELGRVRRGARLLGDATAESMRVLGTRDPRLLGAVAWWLFDAAVLYAMLSAFGGAPVLAVAVLAYFVGQVGNTLPIPGAVSGGIVGVLLAFGVPAEHAVVAVLAYRAVAIWLPGAIGLAALSSLRRTLARWTAEDAGGAHAAVAAAPARAAEPRLAPRRTAPARVGPVSSPVPESAAA